MNFNKKLSVTNFIIFVSLFFTVVLALAWFFDKSISSQEELEGFKELYLQQKKELVRNEVENAVAYIHYKKQNIESELKNKVKHRVYEAHAIATNLYNKFKDTKNRNEIIFIIKESLRDIRFFNGRGYYTIFSLDGTNILHPFYPQYEETQNFSTVKSIKNKFLLDELKNIALSESGEGFSIYDFYRTDLKNTKGTKIGFVKLFKPYGIYIGASEYIKDYEKVVQKEIFDRLRQVRYDNDGYLFIDSWDGVVLMHPMKPEIVGKNLINYKDKHGVYVIKDLIEAAMKPEGDYVYYSWDKPSTHEEIAKFSFSMGIPDWQWMIGGGSYMEDVNSEILYESYLKKQELRSSLSSIAIIVILIILFTLLFMVWWNKKTKSSINIMLSFFEKAAIENIRIKSQGIMFKEFHKMAQYINDMLDSKEKLQKELEKLSVTDPMTNLYNRRSFNDIFSNEIKRAIRKKESLCFIILDIDYFKLYNDQYGHSKGDDAICAVADVLLNTFQRSGEYSFRLGGEEFGVLCSGISSEEAVNLAEAVRQKVLEKNIKHSKNKAVDTLSVSIGLVSLIPQQETQMNDLYKIADKALYEAKNTGRNRVVLNIY